MSAGNGCYKSAQDAETGGNTIALEAIESDTSSTPVIPIQVLQTQEAMMVVHLLQHSILVLMISKQETGHIK